MLEAEDDGHRLAGFRFPLNEEFAATAEVSRAMSVPDRPRVSVTSVSVGVSYEPLRRLAPLLDLYDLAVLHQDVWPEVGDEDDEDESGDRPLVIRTTDDADRAAEQLAPLILAQAVPFAERYMSVDALLAEFLGEVEDDPYITYTAVLAAAGRFDAARASLAGLPVSRRSPLNRSTRRAVRQLRRWVESGGDPSLIPNLPPPSQFSAGTFQSFSELWSQSRSQSRAQQAAVKEVKEGSRGKGRDETRAMLREALTRRGARKQSPLWIENQLDHLWDSPEDRLQLGIRMLTGAARFGLGVAKG
jgi:hypothetical protein